MDYKKPEKKSLRVTLKSTREKRLGFNECCQEWQAYHDQELSRLKAEHAEEMRKKELRVVELEMHVKDLEAEIARLKGES